MLGEGVSELLVQLLLLFSQWNVFLLQWFIISFLGQGSHEECAVLKMGVTKLTERTQTACHGNGP